MKKSAFPATPVPRQHRPNVLPLTGEIDLHVSPAVTESLNAMTEEKPERIVIDLSRATYIDSSGLAALILAMQKREEEHTYVLQSLINVICRPMFETSRLNRIFQIFPDVD